MVVMDSLAKISRVEMAENGENVLEVLYASVTSLALGGTQKVERTAYQWLTIRPYPGRGAAGGQVLGIPVTRLWVLVSSVEL